MITLLFALPAVLRLAEHAVAAPGHEVSLSRRDAGLPAVPALVWVKDEGGTYLMSNGAPGLLLHPDRPDGGNEVVSAEGWGSGTRQLLGQLPEIGGDDFAEYLELTEPPAHGGRTLLDLLRAAARQRLPHLALLVHDMDTISIAFPKPSTIPFAGMVEPSDGPAPMQVWR